MLGMFHWQTMQGWVLVVVLVWEGVLACTVCVCMQGVRYQGVGLAFAVTEEVGHVIVQPCVGTCTAVCVLVCMYVCELCVHVGNRCLEEELSDAI